MTDTTVPTAASGKSGLFTTATLQKAVAFVVLIALIAFFSAFASNFATGANMVGIMQATAVNGVLGVAVTFVIISGGIDLSVGTMMTLTAVMAGIILTNLGMPLPIGILGAILSGAFMGAISGAVIAKLKIPPFIATLGGMFIFKSGILLVTQGKSIFISKNDTYKFIAQGLLPPAAGLILAAVVAAILFAMVFAGRKRKQRYGIALKPLGLDLAKAAAFSVLIFGYVLIVNRTFEPEANANVRGVPFLVVILAIIAALMSYISTNTRFGRYAYAIGGNREAARLSGINIKKSIFGIFVTMGALTGVSGIALAAYVGSGTTGAGGGYELDVIASCILGGTSTLGGEGTVVGAVIGALIMQSLSNGLQMMNVNSNVQYLIKGLVLILAVWADISMKKKKA